MAAAMQEAVALKESLVDYCRRHGNCLTILTARRESKCAPPTEIVILVTSLTMVRRIEAAYDTLTMRGPARGRHWE